MTTVRYSSDGRLIAGGLEDGTIQLWDVRAKHTKANVGMVAASKFQSYKKQNWTVLSTARRIARGAHVEGTNITCLRFGVKNTNALISRGESDGTLKLWDLRSFTAPVATVEGLPTDCVSVGNTQCCFSPNEDLVLTGVGATQSSHGHVAVYDATTLSLVKRLGAPGSVVPVMWHPRLNQIAFGCGDRKQGSARILYDVESSECDKGIVPAVGRRPRQDDAMDVTINLQPEIINPNALPMYRNDPLGRKRDGGIAGRSDKNSKMAKRFQPEKGGPVEKGGQGTLGTGTGNSLLTQYLLKNQGILQPPKDEDVRESILRHADKEDDMKELTKAYAATQPAKLFHVGQDDDEEEEDN